MTNSLHIVMNLSRFLKVELLSQQANACVALLVNSKLLSLEAGPFCTPNN